ncbi:hypothetical protein GALMADRAFT_138815 [Galerina marginata CBS 339.88]|uniref:Uncharacterized protein n=1 Tax=Galerina marginata (strain CBS 339.88) TaxID=685588 RepID=A0A067TCW8_GALM3|nr:hypothetical protein GALMADRAFT_138815 [Galerina marginata CBS 339.88]
MRKTDASALKACAGALKACARSAQLHATHATMLFKTEHIMDIDIWESIPPTNNPKEAMNWKLYAACGRDHACLECLRCLFAVAAYYQRILEAESKGVPIRYGGGLGFCA